MAVRQRGSKDTERQPQKATPGDISVEQIHDALAHLSDPVYLETHPLAARVPAVARRQSRSAGRALREILIAAIDELCPAPSTPVESHAWRGYQIMLLRCVEALEPKSVQTRLAVSRREYYRDHARSIEAVVSILRERWRDGDDAAATIESADRDSVNPPDSLTSLLGSTTRTLPGSLISFVGRDQEVAEVRRLLVGDNSAPTADRVLRPRLLTLLGPPGVGKTRLALEVARGLQNSFPDGVYFVPLAPLRDQPGCLRHYPGSWPRRYGRPIARRAPEARTGKRAGAPRRG